MENTSPGMASYHYMPPEFFFSPSVVSSKTDIWSIGVIFFELLYGRKPFAEGVSQTKILKQGTMLKAVKVDFPEETMKGY